MIKEKIKTSVKGSLKISQNNKILFDGKNTVMATAYDIILQSISNPSGLNCINQMILRDTDGVSVTGIISSYNYPSSDSVKFTTVFNNVTTLNGEMQAVYLKNNTLGNFSVVDLTGQGQGGGNIGFDPANQVMIEWSIQINLNL